MGPNPPTPEELQAGRERMVAACMKAAMEADPDPCSIPLFAQCADWALRLVARICRGRCRAHDDCYTKGGTLDDKLLADMALCLSVRDDLIAAGEAEVATGTAAAIWRGLQTGTAYNRWTFPPPTVERGAQEA